ncbi:hypothetical protein HK101_003609 [Irineochytrium annulatum]|nr:hypothetical protein HK101_003609 [Irineochytrium annulatum]
MTTDKKERPAAPTLTAAQRAEMEEIVVDPARSWSFRKKKPGRKPRPQTAFEMFLSERQRAVEEERTDVESEDGIMNLLKAEFVCLSAKKRADLESSVVPYVNQPAANKRRKTEVVSEPLKTRGAEKEASPTGPTDEELKEQIKTILATGSLHEVKALQVRKQLEEHFKFDLHDRRKYIRTVVNEILLAAAEAPRVEVKFGEREKKEAMAQATAWLKDEGALYKYAGESGHPNLLRRNQPFPLNPLFRPDHFTPLRWDFGINASAFSFSYSDETREKVYNEFRANPELNTPLELAKRYNLSVVRIKAVLRLKSLEKQMLASGTPIQVCLTKGMERLLGVKDGPKLKEPPHYLAAERMTPLYELVDETEGVTPEDAAKILEKEPFVNSQIRLNRQATLKFEEGPPEEVAEDKEKLTSKKKVFNFVDISDPTKKRLLVHDGRSLRPATPLETYQKRTAHPKVTARSPDSSSLLLRAPAGKNSAFLFGEVLSTLGHICLALPARALEALVKPVVAGSIGIIREKYVHRKGRG